MQYILVYLPTCPIYSTFFGTHDRSSTLLRTPKRRKKKTEKQIKKSLWVSLFFEDKKEIIILHRQQFKTFLFLCGLHVEFQIIRKHWKNQNTRKCKSKKSTNEHVNDEEISAHKVREVRDKDEKIDTYL